ncbi:hypothetical protein J1907_03000 [Lysinibacillus sphaericus]|uniref:hypothetical protein n=1 Tax=Lysinibacillus sphaericus TaxID=1421 RepID=UPI0005680F6C|nr:hypothetical protein [Lysinibacillus sphaericus]QTB23098.1 hypothetical protein J1907_03000 [Lysinibacillus sphaericus]
MNNMFSNYEPLLCKCCGKDTLKNPQKSNVVLSENDEGIFDQIFVCCKGECDRKLGSLHGWKDLTEFMNPYLYLQHINAILNNIQRSEKTIFTEESLKSYKEILIKTAPFVFRDMTDEEKRQVEISKMFPY